MPSLPSGGRDRVLSEQFGLEPGVELRSLERRILDQDPTLPIAGERSLVPAAMRASTPFVGRAAELASLREGWAGAVRGSGRIWVMVGPVDSGRTRLAGELAAGVVAGGGWVDYVRGAEGFTTWFANATGGPPLAGVVVDALAERQRRGPLLLVVDDAEWMPPRPWPRSRRLPWRSSSSPRWSFSSPTLRAAVRWSRRRGGYRTRPRSLWHPSPTTTSPGSSPLTGPTATR